MHLHSSLIDIHAAQCLDASNAKLGVRNRREITHMSLNLNGGRARPCVEEAFLLPCATRLRGLACGGSFDRVFEPEHSPDAVDVPVVFAMAILADYKIIMEY